MFPILTRQMRNFLANTFITDLVIQQQGLEDVWHYDNTHSKFIYNDFTYKRTHPCFLSSFSTCKILICCLK